MIWKSLCTKTLGTQWAQIGVHDTGDLFKSVMTDDMEHVS